MNFTKEQAFEKLKGLLTNNGKKALRMSERSIDAQLDALIPLIANDDMELDDFIEKVKSSFTVMNSNVEKDNSDFVKKWEREHKKNDDDDDDGKATDANESLLKRIEELEKRDEERSMASKIETKKNELASALKSKGVKSEAWIRDILSEIDVREDTDVEVRTEALLKLYNKSNVVVDNDTTPLSTSSKRKDLEESLSDVRDLIKRNRYGEKTNDEK